MAGLAVASVALTGCLGPGPAPTPTPTAVFASEDEAFAAAEETYRAYIDAVNARRADPLSEPDPQSFLIGDALERDIDSERELDELGLKLVGPSIVRDVTGLSADSDVGSVTIAACFDSTDARVLNETGEDVTMADRDPTIMVQVSLEKLGQSLLIAQMSPLEGDPC